MQYWIALQGGIVGLIIIINFVNFGFLDSTVLVIVRVTPSNSEVDKNESRDDEEPDEYELDEYEPDEVDEPDETGEPDEADEPDVDDEEL